MTEIYGHTYPGAPATFGSIVKDMAIIGCLIGLAYAYLDLHLSSWENLGLWTIKGGSWVQAAGIALYVVIVVLRVIFSILAIILNVALWAGLIFGGLYFLSHLL